MSQQDPSRLLLFDYSFMQHLGYHAGYGLAYNGVSTGMLYKSLNIIISTLRKLQPTAYAFACDSAPYIRSQLDPNYKGTRPKSDDDFYSQARILTQFLQTGTSAMFRSPGREADDLIAIACRDYYHEFDEIIIYSNDHDLLQLLNDKVMMIDPRSKKVYNLETFAELYNTTPDRWAEIKSIIGDNGDNIPGVYGVSVKTALKYFDGKASAAKTAAIHDFASQRAINLELVTLPPKDFTLDYPDFKYSFTEDMLEAFYTKFGMNSLLKSVSRDVKVLNRGQLFSRL
jgi:5'-3' exonuclease